MDPKMNTNHASRQMDSAKPSGKSSGRRPILLQPTHRKEGEPLDQWADRVVDSVRKAVAKM